VPDTAAGILIHDLDQLHDRMLAIADDVTGGTPRCGDQFTVDHQQAMIIAL
jgi:hypothetical protein